ncbi:hypothetical protein E3N88_07982 [Mikania micrantha]|uniref:Uncharacterized protein n=1 Tax=Mikania micrantha TaxID=192012 RepID=A0A5N6PFZ8_9ASTR|nr:hypothetical protein E3N88_07982 [Mikania micrantha]
MTNNLPPPGFMTPHSAAFHAETNKMDVFPSYGYIPIAASLEEAAGAAMVCGGQGIEPSMWSAGSLLKPPKWEIVMGRRLLIRRPKHLLVQFGDCRPEERRQPTAAVLPDTAADHQAAAWLCSQILDSYSFFNQNGGSPNEPLEIIVKYCYVKCRLTEVIEYNDYLCLDIGKAKHSVCIPVEPLRNVDISQKTSSSSRTLTGSGLTAPVRVHKMVENTKRPAEHPSSSMPCHNVLPLMIISNPALTYIPLKSNAKVHPGCSDVRSIAPLLFLMHSERWQPNELIETIVKYYYMKCRLIEVIESNDYLCLDIGKAKHSVCIPVEDLHHRCEASKECPPIKLATAPVRVHKIVENTRKAPQNTPSFMPCVLPLRIKFENLWDTHHNLSSGYVPRCIGCSNVRSIAPSTGSEALSPNEPLEMIVKYYYMKCRLIEVIESNDYLCLDIG